MTRFSFKRSFDWRCSVSAAFAATIALAYLSGFWEGAIHFKTLRGASCIFFGLIYTLLGTIDYRHFRLTTNTAGKVLYLFVQASLVAAIFCTSRLNAEMSLCVFPLIAATVSLLSTAPAMIGVVVLYAVTLLIEGYFYGANALIRWSISMIPSFGFVVIFTRIAIREKEARTRAEALSAEVEKMAVIQERNRLAREIHDGLGHFLTTIHVQLEGARTIHATNPERALEAVAKAQGLAREALAEVRRSVSALQVENIPGPLTEHLRELASATDDWGAAVSLEILGRERALAPEAMHALFRAAQEGLTNVRKHAQARTASLLLDYRDPRRICVRVTDDGRGINGAPEGCGLIGLRERIASFGGRVLAENLPGRGFRLHVEIPS